MCDVKGGVCGTEGGVPWDWLRRWQHRDKLGTVGNLLLHLRAGGDVGPHLHEGHLWTEQMHSLIQRNGETPPRVQASV